MEESAGFRVAIKPSAVDASDAAQGLIERQGEVIQFDSRDAAEAEAARLSDGEGVRLGIQRAAPQDPTDVDAYLVPTPDRNTHTPLESVDGRHTYETTAAQYGALGEALICSYRSNPPPLVRYIREDLTDAAVGEPDLDDRLWVDLDGDPDPVVVTNERQVTRLRWIPDCVAYARDRVSGEPFERYCCEIKTGDASFQRDQAAVMAYHATVATVLKIRLDVDTLPEKYTVRIERVEPATLPDGLRLETTNDTTLSDFV